MTSSARVLDIGDVNEVGAMFRDGTGAPISPTAVTIVIRSPDYPDTADETITDADSRVTIGATLGDDLADDLDITTAENTAGTGIVQLLHEITQAGLYQYNVKGTAGAKAAVTVQTRVREAFD